MGHTVSGGGKAQTPSILKDGKTLETALVVEKVVIREVHRMYEVPVIKNVETTQVKLVTKEEEQVKYKTTEKETVKYTPVEKETIKYNIKEEETIKYTPVEVKIEKPVVVEKPYERPVIKEKEYTIATIKDIENLRELLDLIPKLASEITSIKAKLAEVKGYKIVEKIIEAPKIQWVNTPVERVVWKDVERMK